MPQTTLSEGFVLFCFLRHIHTSIPFFFLLQHKMKIKKMVRALLSFHRDSRHNFFFVNPNFAILFQIFKIQPTLAHNLATET